MNHMLAMGADVSDSSFGLAPYSGAMDSRPVTLQLVYA
jgi:hypothetical protein